jgi:Kef-type K+ transport system membrane component KefB
MAITGWLVSAALAVAVLASFGFVRDFVPIGLALTTTALGTLLPILQDNDLMSGDFGRYVLAAGAVGELFPILAIAVFLTKRSEYVAIGSLIAVLVAALLLTAAPRLVGERRIRALVKQGQRATAQITATTMPLLIALAAIGLSDGVMLPSNAAALVGAGVVSVLVYPAIATMLHRSAIRSAPR